MTIRRRFWALFIGTMLVVFSLPLFAMLIGSQPIRSLRVVIAQQPPGSQGQTVTLHTPEVVLVQVTDTDGILVDNADLQTSANMSLMDMGVVHFQAQQIRQGLYRVNLSFTMPGSWWVRLEAQAPHYQKASQQLTF